MLFAAVHLSPSRHAVAGVCYNTVFYWLRYCSGALHKWRCDRTRWKCPTNNSDVTYLTTKYEEGGRKSRMTARDPPSFSLINCPREYMLFCISFCFVWLVCVHLFFSIFYLCVCVPFHSFVHLFAPFPLGTRVSSFFHVFTPNVLAPKGCKTAEGVSNGVLAIWKSS